MMESLKGWIVRRVRAGVLEAAVGEFEAVLREQVAAARRELAAARAVRDYAGIKSYGLRLRYLEEIAQEHHVELPVGDVPGGAPPVGRDGG